MKNTENQELEQLITSLIGERPIERNQNFNSHLVYYFTDTTNVDRIASVRNIILNKLYFPVFCSEINPSTIFLASTLDMILEDCFGIKISSLIIEEMESHKLIGCPEEKMVIAHYNTNDRSSLIKHLNNLFAKVENAAKEILVDREFLIKDYGY